MADSGSKKDILGWARPGFGFGKQISHSWAVHKARQTGWLESLNDSEDEKYGEQLMQYLC